MTYEKADELAALQQEAIDRLVDSILAFRRLLTTIRPHLTEFHKEEMLSLCARDALIDLIRFCGPEVTQQAIEIANSTKT